MIVCHTMQGFLRGTDAWFANPASRVSAHYSVGLNGEIHQHVPEEAVAWHAGNWPINQHSIGIEFEDANNPFGVSRTQAQYDAGAWLIADICTRRNLAIDRNVIKKHNEVSNSHPNCPGNLNVDWLAHLAAERVAPPPTSGDVTATIAIVVDVLNARTGPGLQFPVVAQFHRGAATITGWTKGQEVTIGNRTDDIWLRSQAGHWAAQAGTSANFGHVPGKLSPTEHAHLALSTSYGVVGKQVRDLLIRRKSK